jgi:hypothetical protein
VATLLTDVEPVAEHASAALQHIAAGATDATAVLVELLMRPDAPDPLVSRALLGLRSIGPEAWSAIRLLEKMYDGPHRVKVLEAMAAIAPKAPKVAERLVEAVFSDEPALSRVAHEALRDELADAAAAQLRLRTFSFSKKKRAQAHRVAAAIARHRPEPVAQLMIELARGSRPARPILEVTCVLPLPVARELVAFATRYLSAEDVTLQELALRAMRKLPAVAPVAPLLERHEDAPPLAGASGRRARVFAEAALMLSQRGLLGDADRERVDAWLTRAAAVEPGKAIDWHTVATVWRAAPTPEHAQALTSAACAFAASDPSGVGELHRALRERLPPESLAHLGVPGDTDPIEASTAAEAEYPEFPPDEVAAPPGRLEPAQVPPDGGELSLGLALTGRSLTATPADLAQSLQVFFERQQRESRPSPEDAEVLGLGAVWAHCLMQAFKWSWAWYVRAPPERALVLASPDKNHMVFPAAWVRRQLRKREPTVQQQFEQIGAKRLPPPDAEPSALW